MFALKKDGFTNSRWVLGLVAVFQTSHSDYLPWHIVISVPIRGDHCVGDWLISSPRDGVNYLYL
jgi:hypothetical protein